MPIKDHIHHTLKINKEATPLYKMLLSCIVMTVPLIIGFIRHEHFLSMFGALMGLVYFLNDHFGSLYVRVRHLIIAHCFFMAVLYIGSFFTGKFFLMSLAIFFLSFMVGLSKGYGIELERLILFIALEFLTASSDQIISDSMTGLIIYSHITLAIYILSLYLLHFVFGHSFHKMNSKQESLKKIISTLLERKMTLKFPLICALLSLGSFLFFHQMKFTHLHWIIGTALIVMMPDSYLGIYKSVQRILGTFAGAIIGAIVISLFPQPIMLITAVAICAFFMPNAMSKNYWVGNVTIASLILFFLEFALPGSIALHHLAYWRIVDIALGSSVGIVCSLILSLKFTKNKKLSIH